MLSSHLWLAAQKLIAKEDGTRPASRALAGAKGTSPEEQPGEVDGRRKVKAGADGSRCQGPAGRMGKHPGVLCLWHFSVLPSLSCSKGGFRTPSRFAGF